MNSIKDWSPEARRKLRKAATNWFDSFGRNLPWRNTSDPYRIWVSEIMLQQTQVATVIPYYDRFLQSFPNVSALALASEESVFFHWAGLGYYRRAKQLHAAAKVIHHERSGVFPETIEEVMRLPGIGRYTAGAILSFAHDVRAPIVEANTQRIYARLLALRSPLADPQSQKCLWDFAEAILPQRTGSGHLNQSMMELGSQVCLPRDPNCLICPLRPLCPTWEQGLQSSIPVPKPPKIYTDVCEAAIILENRAQPENPPNSNAVTRTAEESNPQRKWFMRRCGAGERWAGLWDFPRFVTTDVNQDSQLVPSLEQTFQKQYGFPIEITDEQAIIKHGVTKYRISLRCFVAFTTPSPSKRKTKTTTSLESEGTGWFSLDQMQSLPLSSTGKRLLKRIERDVEA